MWTILVSIFVILYVEFALVEGQFFAKVHLEALPTKQPKQDQTLAFFILSLILCGLVQLKESHLGELLEMWFKGPNRDVSASFINLKPLHLLLFYMALCFHAKYTKRPK